MRITPKNLLDLSFEQLPKLLWIGGDAPHLLNELVQHVKILCNDNGFEICLVEFPGTDLTTILDSLDQASLFSENKLIVIYLKQLKVPDAFISQLKDWFIKNSPASKILLQSPSFESKQLHMPLLSFIEKEGCLLPLWPLTNADLLFWIQRIAKKLELGLEQAVLDYLPSAIEGNLESGIQALNVLALAHGPGKIINLMELETGLSAAGHYDVYKLIDSSLSANSERTFKILSSLKREGTALALVLWAATQLLQELIGFKTQLNTRSRPARTALLHTASKSFDTSKLTSYLSYLSELDQRLKQGQSNLVWQALTWFFLELSGIKKSFNPVLMASLSLERTL